jgi:hypothetical protein
MPRRAPEEKSTLYVRVPMDVYAELVRRSRAQGQTVSAYVRSILYAGLEAHPEPGRMTHVENSREKGK